MKAVFTLTSAESKRLIAKAVVAMPEVKQAWQDAYLLLADGTTNAYIAQELLGDRSIDPALCAIGISTDGLLCVTEPCSRRCFPNVFQNGQISKKSFSEALADYHRETVVIKGANAVDPDGYVGILASGFDGGTIPRIIGPVTSKGLKLITPVGLNKLVPSVRASALALGGSEGIDLSLGADPGMYCIGTSVIVTEIEAIRILFDCSAVLVCCGGVGGNEGAVTLAAEGEAAGVEAMIDYLEANVKGEPAVGGNRGSCRNCRYRRCRYYGKEEAELPAWMRR